MDPTLKYGHEILIVDKALSFKYAVYIKGNGQAYSV